MQQGRRTASLKASYEAVAGGDLAHHALQAHHTHHDHGIYLSCLQCLGNSPESRWANLVTTPAGSTRRRQNHCSGIRKPVGWSLSYRRRRGCRLKKEFANLTKKCGICIYILPRAVEFLASDPGTYIFQYLCYLVYIFLQVMAWLRATVKQTMYMAITQHHIAAIIAHLLLIKGINKSKYYNINITDRPIKTQN